MTYMCCGIIVYKLFNNTPYFALVKTHKGRYSFPKGKKIMDETYKNCAIRETKEEIGLTEHDYIFIFYKNKEYYTFYEFCETKKRLIIYYVAECATNKAINPEDPNEICWVGWLNLSQIKNLSENEFSKKRVDIATYITKQIVDKKTFVNI